MPGKQRSNRKEPANHEKPPGGKYFAFGKVGKSPTAATEMPILRIWLGHIRSPHAHRLTCNCSIRSTNIHHEQRTAFGD
jgi:hypothetical protein